MACTPIGSSLSGARAWSALYGEGTGHFRSMWSAGLPYVVPTAGDDLVALVKQTAAVLPYREGLTELIEARLRTPPV